MDETQLDEFSIPQTSSWDQAWAKPILDVMKTLWLMSLFVGGMIFLVYFALIGFVPELDAKTSITLLATSAFTGIWILALLSLGLLGPGWSWRRSTNNNEKLQVLWRKGEKFVWWRAMLWVALPFVGIEAGSLILYSLSAWHGLNIWWVNAPLILILFIPSLVVVFFWKKLLGTRRWFVASDLLRGFLISTGAVLFLLLMLYMFSRQVLDLSNTTAVIVFLVGMVLSTLLNAIIATMPLVPIRRLVVVSLALLVIIFTVLNTWTSVPKLVMNTYKFGNLPNVFLVLDEIGCTIAQYHKLKVTPPPTAAPSSNQKTCSLDIMIHSRLGNTYYLEASRTDGSNVRFTIPSQNVLSWSVNESKSTQNQAVATKGMEPTH